MKKAIYFFALGTGLAAMSFHSSTQENLSGGWEIKDGAITHTLVIADDYFSITSFERESKKFISTYGGTMKTSPGKVTGKIEFNSAEKAEVGKDYSHDFKLLDSGLQIVRNNKKEIWTRTDNGQGPLAGNWKIIKRDGHDIANRGARKTIKLLSGKRFQWAAINTETGDFSGTGGGSYTFENGKYTEHIEFFSRDSNRVGMSLSFDAKVDGRLWYHSGKSSTGAGVDEVWTR